MPSSQLHVMLNVNILCYSSNHVSPRKYRGSKVKECLWLGSPRCHMIDLRNGVWSVQWLGGNMIHENIVDSYIQGIIKKHGTRDPIWGVVLGRSMIRDLWGLEWLNIHLSESV